MTTDGQQLDPTTLGETGMTRRAALLAGALGAGGLLTAQGGLGAAAALRGCDSRTRRAPARRARRRGQGRVVQPGPRLVVHRRLALLQPLRPAGARQSGLLAVAGARARSGRRMRPRTNWEVKLRPGVKWHDGSPFTADDVIYTLRQMGNPKHVGHAAVLNISLGGRQEEGPVGRPDPAASRRTHGCRTRSCSRAP